jgi:hypothetical protein
MDNAIKPVSRRLRFEILKRDGHRCRYCGASAPDVPLTVDHVIPRSLGGGNEPSNLATACSDCNIGKSSVSPDAPTVEQVRNDAEKFRAALAHVAEIDRYKRDLKFEHYDAMVCDFAQEWHGMCNETGLNFWLDSQARASLIRFAEHGLSESDLYHAMHETFARATPRTKGWLYFCGICWNMIRIRTEMAIAHMEANP